MIVMAVYWFSIVLLLLILILSSETEALRDEIARRENCEWHHVSPFGKPATCIDLTPMQEEAP